MNKNTIVLTRGTGFNPKDLNNAQSCKIEQEKIDLATAEFLAGGGKVQELAGYGLQTGAINPITSRRESCTTKQKLIFSVRGCLKTSEVAMLYIKNGKYTCRGKEQSEDDGFELVKSFTNVQQMKDFEPKELS